MRIHIYDPKHHVDPKQLLLEGTNEAVIREKSGDDCGTCEVFLFEADVAVLTAMPGFKILATNNRSTSDPRRAIHYVRVRRTTQEVVAALNRTTPRDVYKKIWRERYAWFQKNDNIRADKPLATLLQTQGLAYRHQLVGIAQAMGWSATDRAQIEREAEAEIKAATPA